MNNPLRSLAGRIILLVFAATVVSAFTVSWISVQSLDGFLRQKVDQRFPQIAIRVSRELDQWYTLRARELAVFASSTILTESTSQLISRGPNGHRARQEVEQYLRYLLDNFPQFARLVLAKNTGEVLVEVGDGELLPKGLFVGSATETTSISDPYRIDGHLVQIASSSMADGSGRSIGRLYALIDFAGLTPVLSSWELGQSANVFIVDRDMRYMNPPPDSDPDALYTPRLATSSGRDSAVSEVGHYYNVQNIRVIGTHLDFPRFGWTIVLEQPYDDAFAPVMDSIGDVAGMNLAIVLIVSLVASRLAGSFVKPLGALSDAAKRLAEGQRGVEIDENAFSSDEVQVLTRTFNEMSRGLGRNSRELELSNLAVEAANGELIAKNQELSNMNLVLEQLAITDGLTKLHNHRYFQESIIRECKRSLRSNEPVSLVLIDIDHFKKWNDRLGHAGGDEILGRLAEILNRCVRETDILTRYGGEEFALIAVNTDLAGAVALAEKIRAFVEATDFVTHVPSEKDQLTVSIGVATLVEDRIELFADADAALYKAKDSGRNRVIATEISQGKNALIRQTRED